MKVKGFIRLLLETLLVVTLVYTFFSPYKVQGDSMLPTYATGHRVFINRLYAYTKAIDYGDAVVCVMDNDTVIKRVIALPGDRLKISNGLVYINGQALEEAYLAEGTYTGGDVSLTLGTDQYFVLGDNRGVSRDSRHLGPISGQSIKGKVIFKL